MSKNLTIAVSNIAPLIGLDAYNNFPRIICEIWRKYNPIDYNKCKDKLKLKGITAIATSNELNDIWEADEAIGTKVTNINNNKDKSSSDMVSQQNDILKEISKSTTLDATQKVELSKKVCSVTNKMHGVNNEDAILDEFCRLSEKTIKDTQQWLNIQLPYISNTTSTTPTTTSTTTPTTTSTTTPINNISWSIVGKYDGITTDNELVEAKMRQKCLFKKLRDYENVQIQLYMHALNITKAYLVESYTNKKNKNEIYVNETNYDEDYVRDIIISRVYKFIEFFDVFMANEDYRESLLLGDKDRRIYTIYESSF